MFIYLCMIFIYIYSPSDNFYCVVSVYYFCWYSMIEEKRQLALKRQEANRLVQCSGCFIIIIIIVIIYCYLT